MPGSNKKKHDYYVEYEKRTKQIVEEVKKASPNLQDAVIRHGPTNKIEGASGFNHQIDVSIEIPNTKLILVECKRYKSKVSLPNMLILIARINDIREKKLIDVRGMFFTPVGYTKPARKVGSHYGIELNTFKDIKKFAVKVAGNFFIKPPTIKLF